jgi:hypothetical protein
MFRTRTVLTTLFPISCKRNRPRETITIHHPIPNASRRSPPTLPNEKTNRQSSPPWRGAERELRRSGQINRHAANPGCAREPPQPREERKSPAGQGRDAAELVDGLAGDWQWRGPVGYSSPPRVAAATFLELFAASVAEEN